VHSKAHWVSLTAARNTCPPPALGAHSRVLLQQLGYADDAIGALCEAGVVGLPADQPDDQPTGAPG